MMDLVDRLLGHDCWTTEQLLLRCRELKPGQWEEQFDLGHQTLPATFAHMIGNVRVWTDLMAERPVRDFPGAPGSTPERMVEQWRLAYADFAAFARAIADQDRWDASYVDVLDNPPRRKSFGGTIGHVITHNMHHRGEVIHMLTRLGLVDVLEGDLLGWEQQAHGGAGPVGG
jgi:uncharacterized damage-inducible protein DinB